MTRCQSVVLLVLLVVNTSTHSMDIHCVSVVAVCICYFVWICGLFIFLMFLCITCRERYASSFSCVVRVLLICAVLAGGMSALSIWIQYIGGGWGCACVRACVRLPHVYTRVKSTSQNGPNTFSRIVCSSRSLAGRLDSLAWNLGKLMECVCVRCLCIYDDPLRLCRCRHWCCCHHHRRRLAVHEPTCSLPTQHAQVQWKASEQRAHIIFARNIMCAVRRQRGALWEIWQTIWCVDWQGWDQCASRTHVSTHKHTHNTEPKLLYAAECLLYIYLDTHLLIAHNCVVRVLYNVKHINELECIFCCCIGRKERPAVRIGGRKMRT